MRIKEIINIRILSWCTTKFFSSTNLHTISITGAWRIIIQLSTKGRDQWVFRAEMFGEKSWASLRYRVLQQQQQQNIYSLIHLQVNDFMKNHRFELRDEDLKKWEIITVI